MGAGEAEAVDLEDLRLHHDAVGFFDVVAADDDVVGVKGLGDADGGGAGGLEVEWVAEMVERVEAVVTRDGEVSGGGEALVEGVGEGIRRSRRELVWPERLSKGRTRTTRPGGVGSGVCAYSVRQVSRMAARLISQCRERS